MAKKRNQLKWDRLDNTAHLFPVIAGEGMSNVYRISVTLREEVDPGLLQEALAKVLPWFDGFRVRLRKGVFWYYFEENKKPAPRVHEEDKYPNQYISPNKNRSYLFRVTYYRRRINLEVFHVLTDGMGGINFLRELTYQYLRLAHPGLMGQEPDALCSGTSLNREDSFLKHYKKSHARGYQTKRAYCIRGERLEPMELGLIHGYMPVSELKNVCRAYGVSINEYLVGVFIWSIYRECLHEGMDSRPVSVAVPVNLRPYYNSNTTKNFFVMVSALFEAKKESCPFEEVLGAVTESLRGQITPEHLEALFSYNVSNEKNLMLRMVPLFVKNLAIRWVYQTSALANTSTLTNIGSIQVREEYQPYIDKFHAFLSMSKGQNIKGCVCSYQDTLTFTFSSTLQDVSVQKCFFQKLAADGISAAIETNGVYHEEM